MQSSRLRRFTVAAITVAAGVAIASPAVAQPSPYDGRIVGQVVTATGQPAPNVRVNVYESTTTYPQASVTTDATGSYAVVLDAYSQYKLEFVTPDFRRQWAHQKTSAAEADVFSLTAGQDTVVDEVLFAVGTVVVTATDKVTGAPVTAFSAEAWGQGIGRNGYTETGSVTLPDLPPGDYTVTVYPIETHFSAHSTATVVGNQTTQVSLQVEPAAVITTTLVDAATNAPVENACIQPVGELQVLGPDVHNCSGPDGRVTVGYLPTGSYRIFAKAKDGVHGAQWAGPWGGTGSRYLARVVEARAGQTVTVPPIRLDRAGSITGTVVDQVTGEPVADICAYPFATGTGAGPGAGPHCSDQQGRYTIDGLGPYHWPVEFVGDYRSRYAWQWSGDRPNQLTAQLIKVRVGQASTADAHLAAEAKVRGRVVNADGSPAQGYLHAYNALTGDIVGSHTFPDENGYYELPHLAGQFVRVEYVDYPDDSRHWYRDESDFRSADPVWVPSAGVTSGIDFLIPSG